MRRSFVILAIANAVLARPLLGVGGLIGSLDPLGLIPALTGTQPQTPAAPAPSTRPPSPSAIANARNQWLADTVIVSRFLSIAETLTPSQMTSEATKALNAENDELTHKAVLDRQFLSAAPDQSVRQANNVLDTQGTFQFVVDGLQRLSTSGAKMTPEQISTNIRAMNEDRCVQVLPAIDMYFAAVGTLLQEDNLTQAKRPTNCPPNNGTKSKRT